jgi:hypothetical protein
MKNISEKETGKNPILKKSDLDYRRLCFVCIFECCGLYYKSLTIVIYDCKLSFSLERKLQS